MAANLRQCAQLNGNGRYVPQNTVKRFSSGEDDLKKPVQLFGGLTRKLSTNSHDPVEGKPHSKNDQRVVAGIPVEPTRPYTRNYSQSPYNTPNAKPSPPLHSANYPPSSNESNYKKKMNEIRKKMGKPLDVESPLPSVTRKPSATSNSSRDSANSKYSRIEKAYRTCANKM
ncbi:hypothetical protein AGDE_15991 [Angomonas deanei]|nr:hypothetical protein AGDE_15991 [Angomonas deanei]|eukprot:EPY17968.1 hypothetical protein AGDE_15991 [Angomonas deanei]